MTKITSFEKTSDPGFVPALDENLRDLHRRVERQAEKSQRIKGLKTLSGFGVLEIPHNLGIVPKSVTLEAYASLGDWWFSKPHTAKSIFIVAVTSTVEFDVVLRG